MYSVTLAHHEDFAGWREAARALALAGVPPEEVSWQVDGQGAADMFGDETLPDALPDQRLTVPKPFLSLAQSVICHSDPERFALLYTMLLKLQRERQALDDRADPLTKRLEVLRKAVGRDLHKMRAFVRFREMEDGEGGTRYVAWFEPEHHIVRTNAPFFQRRFASMNWSILTPELCAHWNGEGLSFSEGATKADAPAGDPVEETWKTYFRSIFNPARVKVKAMTAEMPKKYWKNMPETALVPGADRRRPRPRNGDGRDVEETAVGDGEGRPRAGRGGGGAHRCRRQPSCRVRGAAGGGEALHALRPPQAGDADGVRRGGRSTRL